MKPSGMTDLDRLKRDLEQRLAAAIAADPPPWREIDALSRRLSLTKSLAASFERRPSPWLAPAALLLVAISLTLAAAAFGPHQVPLQVDGSVSGFSIATSNRAQPMRGLLEVKAGSLASSQNLGWATPAWLSEVTTLEEIRVSADTQLEFALAGKGCHRVRVQRGELAVQLTAAKVASGEVQTGQAVVHQGEELRFCMKDKGTLYPESATRLQLATELDASHPPILFAPSILRAEMQVLSTAQVKVLRQTDRLSLNRIVEARVAIVLDDAQAVHFAGKVEDPEIFGFTGPIDHRGRSLRPSWLEIVKSSPEAARLFAAVTGLLGILLGARRWLTSGVA